MCLHEIVSWMENLLHDGSMDSKDFAWMTTKSVSPPIFPDASRTLDGGDPFIFLVVRAFWVRLIVDYVGREFPQFFARRT